MKCIELWWIDMYILKRMLKKNTKENVGEKYPNTTKKMVPLDCSLTLSLDASFLKEVVARPYIYLIIWQAEVNRWLLKHDIVKITYNMITYILLLNTLRSSLFEASSRINCLFSISSSHSSFIFLPNILARFDTTRYVTWPSGWPQLRTPHECHMRWPSCAPLNSLLP